MRPARYCKFGHDTSVVGRNASRTCNTCQRQFEKRWRETSRGRAMSNDRQARYEGTAKGILTQVRRHTEVYSGRS